MSRSIILSYAALLLVTDVASAQTINGGGSFLASPAYELSFVFFSYSDPTADFSDFYTPASSLEAEQAFISNQASGLSNTTAPLHFATSDATATPSQLYGAAGWNVMPSGRQAAGNLIIIPTLGTGVAIPINFANVTSNYSVNLTDADLCGIFSGKLTSWYQTYYAWRYAPPSAPITVFYRNDGGGDTYLLTQHLAAVCSRFTPSPSAINFIPTLNWSDLFKSMPSNFVPVVGEAGMQQAISSTRFSIGYIGPDYTKIVSSPVGGSSAPYVATINGIAPTSAEIAASLARGVPITDPNLNPSGTYYSPVDPNSFVPVAADPVSGGSSEAYPIVGYTTMWVAQCYKDPNVALAIRNFIYSLYHTASIESVETSLGFAAVPAYLSGRVTAAYLYDGTYDRKTASNLINGAGSGDCVGYAGR